MIYPTQSAWEKPNAFFLQDMKLLRFSSVFAMTYMVFTIITGSFNNHIVDFPNELHIVNGVISILQISLQITFIRNLKQKVRLQRGMIRRSNFMRSKFVFS
jgi:hypothetical protein